MGEASLALRHVHQEGTVGPAAELIAVRPWARLRRFGHLLWHVPGMFRGDVHRAVTWRGHVRFVPWGWFGWTMERGELHVECDCERSW